jgi:alkylation response protein AidB-like acyl-CoA dehydrogenase
VHPRAACRQIYQIWEGTAEIQRLVIARELTGLAL